MSITENTAYLESASERFTASMEGKERKQILCEMYQKGFTIEADELVEDWYNKRLLFLKEHGVSYEDVMRDDEGEFFMYEQENGNPGEDDYSVETRMRRIPDFLDLDYWLKADHVCKNSPPSSGQ